MNVFERFQLDVEQALLSSNLLQYVAITRLRPRTEAEAAGIQSKINRTLAGLEARNGKQGVSCIVGMPTISGVAPGLRQVKGDLGLRLDFIENIAINGGANGTGGTAEDHAWTAARLLPHLHLSPLGVVASDPRLIEPVEAAVLDKSVMYRVAIRLLHHDAGIAKVATPVITVDGAEMTLSCTTAGAAIYWTDDGSWPGSGNAEATLYSVPVTLASGTHGIRVGAQLDDYAPSDVVAETVVV